MDALGDQALPVPIFSFCRNTRTRTQPVDQKSLFGACQRVARIRNSEWTRRQSRSEAASTVGARFQIDVAPRNPAANQKSLSCCPVVRKARTRCWESSPTAGDQPPVSGLHLRPLAVLNRAPPAAAAVPAAAPTSRWSLHASCWSGSRRAETAAASRCESLPPPGAILKPSTTGALVSPGWGARPRARHHHFPPRLPPFPRLFIPSPSFWLHPNAPSHFPKEENYSWSICCAVSLF